MLTRRVFQSKIAWSLALAVLAALVLVGINEASYRQSSQALAAITRAQDARVAINLLRQSVLGAETGQRGYLLTGRDSYRQPYDAAVREIGPQLKRLRELYTGSPQDLKQLAQLSDHLSRKLAEMDVSVRMKRNGNEDATNFVLTTDVGHEEMQRIQASTDAMLRSSDEALNTGREQIAHSLRVARTGIALVVVVALVAFILYLQQTSALQSAGERQQQALQRERNRLEEEVRERTSSLAELATHLQEVRETERGYLARELHDELGALLTAAKLDVARLKSRLSDSPDATQRLLHLTELLNSGIALKRRIIEDLRPSSLSNLGLEASLEILGREFGERAGLQVNMALEPTQLDESRQLTIYRMVQEGLTNIGKYAEAREVSVVLHNYKHHVLVEVSDDGRGFDTQRSRPSSHGLAGMRHRVETAGGKLSIRSAPGRGTQLRATLPSVAPRPAAGPDAAAPASA